jgi:hypothetical protein
MTIEWGRTVGAADSDGWENYFLVAEDILLNLFFE